MEEYQGYTIALYGDDVYRKPDANSEIDLADLPGGGDPLASAEWLKIKVIGLKPGWDMLNEPWEGDGGRRFQRKGQIRTFSIETGSLMFPDDMALYDAIAEVINHYSVYLFKGDYDGADNWSVHSEGRALYVSLGFESEHSYPNGSKTVTLAGSACEPRR